ncbi:MAG: hypothetical protein ABSB35_10240 [Bryobacteraceae bacterium]|jgi:hypothetical protein
MFNKMSLFVRALVTFTGLLGASAANAQTRNCYTVASLQGSYAVVANYGANVAIALGTRFYDGNGNLTATFIVNEPTAGSTTGARTLVTGTQTGTYTVNCDGTGKIYRILTASNGITSTQTDDFIITGAIVQNGLIATSIVDAVETPSAIVAGGIFVTRIQTRLPDYFN